MLAALRHAMAHVGTLRGRDTRRTFWIWVLAVAAFRFVANLAVWAPLAWQLRSVGGRPDSLAMAWQVVLADLPRLIWGDVVIGWVTMALLAACLVRRLHDSARSGWWALAPTILYGFVLLRMPQQISLIGDQLLMADPHHGPDAASLTRMSGLFALLPYVAAGFVVWFGLQPSTPGPNRFGPAPHR